MKEIIEKYEVLKSEEDSIQAMSIKVKGFPHEVSVTAVYCPHQHNQKRNNLKHSFKH